MYPTVAEILEIPVVAAGRPVVRAGRTALDTAVRWVHVSELRDPAGTLSGGELVLSIGVPVSDPATDAAAYLTGLRDAGAAALMIELGQHLRSLPDALVQAARAMEFPLVELRRTVRFVELTEAVHARVLTEQYARLQFAQRVADTFRGLAVDGAGAERVVHEAAGLLGLPVVLEDLGHRALFMAGGEARRVLRDWAARSRQTPRAPVEQSAGPEGWRTAPVGRHGARWGRLVVPVRSDDDRVPMVLGQAADTVTLQGLLDPETGTAARLAQERLLADLLALPHSTEGDLRTRVRALGLDTTGTYQVLALAHGSEADGADLAGAATAAADRLRVPALVGRLPDGAVAVVLSDSTAPHRPDAVQSIVDEVSRVVEGVTAAAEAPGFAQLSEAIAEAAHVLEVVAADPAPHARRVWRARDLGLNGLLWALRHDPRLLAYVEEQLGPILQLGATRRAELLRSVRAFAEADGVVSAFAARIGTSRPAAYARLRKLSEILGKDLADPAVKRSVQVAVLATDLIDLEL